MGNPQLAASKSGAHCRIRFQLQRPNCSQGDNKNRRAFVLTKLFFNGSFQASPVEVSTRQPLNHPGSAQSSRAKALGRAGAFAPPWWSGRKGGWLFCLLSKMEKGEDVRQAGLTHNSRNWCLQSVRRALTGTGTRHKH